MKPCDYGQVVRVLCGDAPGGCGRYRARGGADGGEVVQRAPSTTRLGGPLGVSVVLHASLIAAAIFVRPEHRRVLPPVYKVNLIAAPAGPRAIGAGRRRHPRRRRRHRPLPPKRAETNPRDMPAPTKPKPTPRKPARTRDAHARDEEHAEERTPRRRRAADQSGGTGTDVANVKTEGVEFPYPGYLNNIVRQIALRFKPRNPGALRAEVFFIVRRDGSLASSGFSRNRACTHSISRRRAPIESAGSAKAFGGLPDGYVNDFLPVIFSFDPSLFR